MICVLGLLAALGYGIWRAAAHAKSIEDDTRYLMEGHDRSPYGRTFLSILSGRGSGRS